MWYLSSRREILQTLLSLRRMRCLVCGQSNGLYTIGYWRNWVKFTESIRVRRDVKGRREDEINLREGGFAKVSRGGVNTERGSAWQVD